MKFRAKLYVRECLGEEFGQTANHWPVVLRCTGKATPFWKAENGSRVILPEQ